MGEQTTQLPGPTTQHAAAVSFRRLLTVSAIVLALALVVTSSASAALSLLKPTPDSSSTFAGNGGYSADGLGQQGIGGVLHADVPGGSTVEQAYLYGTYFFSTPTDADRTINFDGTNVLLSPIPGSAPACWRQLRVSWSPRQPTSLREAIPAHWPTSPGTTASSARASRIDAAGASGVREP